MLEIACLICLYVTKLAEATKTGVFWDVEECPIPEDLDPESVYQNIRSALANKGYHDEVKIMAFGDRNQIPGYYESAGIEIYPVGITFLFLLLILIPSHLKPHSYICKWVFQEISI